MMHRIAAIVATTGLGLLLAACAQTADLKPVAGKQLPVAPYGREDRPAAEELLQPPTQAAPERSVELQTRSEPREDDPSPQ